MALTYASGFWGCRKIGSNTCYHFCFIGRENKPSNKLTHPRACKELQQKQTTPEYRNQYTQPRTCPRVPGGAAALTSLTWHPAAHSRAFNCNHHSECSLSCMESSPPTTGNGTFGHRAASPHTSIAQHALKEKAAGSADSLWDNTHLNVSYFVYCICDTALLTPSQQGALSFQLSDVTFQSIFFHNVCFIHNIALHSF